MVDRPPSSSHPSPPPLDELAGRAIIIGLSGGIACYKVCHVVSALTQAQAQVTVVMTEAATRFVSPLTFQALSGRPVYSSQWEHIEAKDPQHVATARAADLMLIAPCTMNMLSKLATGRADDAVTIVAAAMDLKRRPVLLAPSMNEQMYLQPSTQRNLQQLRADGFAIIDPATGWQACRTEGVGRLPEPEVLLRAIVEALPTGGRPA